ncbi:uncharacterized protein LOC123405851, partial [Hordeum vulgare subsp. vulgare]|uniref:uncharacterized protein LOC123405851 n=1 Tax=Hordeum vulgare subsp. vulgare TaxID=112509 RepID=UPI001D1A4E34
GETAEATTEATAAAAAGEDPGVKGGGSNTDHACGGSARGEIGAILLDDREPFAEIGKSSCETQVIFRTTALIRTWSLLTPVAVREPMVTGCVRWKMVAQGIFNRFGWRHINRIGV